MRAPSDLAPWAADVRSKHGKLRVTLRRGLDVGGVLSLLKNPSLSSVKALKIPGSVGLTGLRELVRSPRLQNLQSIAINGFADPDDAVEEIFDSKVMAGLRVLKVWGVSDAIDVRLARGEYIKELRQLDIRSSPELTSLDRYFASPRVETLRFVTINGTALADTTELFANKLAVNVRSLSLAKSEIGPETIDELGTSPNLTGLRKLNLSYMREDDAMSNAMYKLLRSRALPELETLVLCGCEVENFDWSRVQLPNVRKLDLRDNALSLGDFQEILESPGLPKLEQLVVSSPEEVVPARHDKRLIIDDRRPSFL